MDKRVVLEYLKRNEINNISLINFINNNEVIGIYRNEDSIVVKGKSDEIWTYICSKSEEKLKELLNKIDYNEQYFADIEDWMIPILFEAREIDWRLACFKLVYLEDDKIIDNKYDIRNLSTNDSKYIYENYEYKEYTTFEYIRVQIEKGIALGVYEENKLVGWIITQDDGAMGFLTVLKDYRRKGYGIALSCEMINRIKGRGCIPFAHVEEENVKSMQLLTKLGFKKIRNTNWVKVKE